MKKSLKMRLHWHHICYNWNKLLYDSCLDETRKMQFRVKKRKHDKEIRLLLAILDEYW